MQMWEMMLSQVSCVMLTFLKRPVRAKDGAEAPLITGKTNLETQTNLPALAQQTCEC